MRQKVSDLTLEQYHLGELSAAQERIVREELANDEVLRGRLAAIRKSDEEIRSSYPSERIVPRILERATFCSSAMPPGTREAHARRLPLDPPEADWAPRVKKQG
jgi:anti-sigma factor RsiW